MIKRPVTKDLHHHIKCCQTPLYLVPSLHDKLRLLFRYVDYTFPLQSGFFPLKTIQNGISNSGDGITHFLGIDSKEHILNIAVFFTVFKEASCIRILTFLQERAKGLKAWVGFCTLIFYVLMIKRVAMSCFFPGTSFTLTWQIIIIILWRRVLNRYMDRWWRVW